MSAYEQYRERIKKTHGIDINDYSDSSRGGRADRFPIKDITKYDLDEIMLGIEVETEHTSDKMKALEIVLDHLSELPDYYTRLKKMEQRGRLAKAIDDLLLKGKKNIAKLVKKRVMSKRGHMMTVWVRPEGKKKYEKDEPKQKPEKKKITSSFSPDEIEAMKREGWGFSGGTLVTTPTKDIIDKNLKDGWWFVIDTKKVLKDKAFASRRAAVEAWKEAYSKKGDDDVLTLTPDDLHEVDEGKSKKKKVKRRKAIPEKKVVKDPYQDVGEKIGGARKDLAAMIQHYKRSGNPITADDLEVLEQDQKVVAALLTRDRQAGTKQQIIETMKAAGAGPGAVYMVMNTIAMIPPKPAEETPEARRQFIAAIDYITRSIRNVKTVEEWKEWRSMIKDVSEAKVSGDDFDKYKDLLEQYSKKSREDDDMRERFNKSGGPNWHEDYRKWRRESGIESEMSRLNQERFQMEREARKNAQENPYSEYNLVRALGKRFDKYMFFPVMRLRKSWVLSEEAAKMEADDDWSKIGIKRDARAAKRKTPTWEREAPEKVERSGGREIKGKVSSKKLMDMVGLRAVEYGNYMDKDSSAEHTKRCAEAFIDLADVIGIDPKMVSFNGRLALAFGARGKGKFKAHYEPYKQVINMTKFNGGGSLAHEWGHFLDNVAAVVYGGGVGNSFMSDKSARAGVPIELTAAFADVKRAMFEGSLISKRKISRTNISHRRRVYIISDKDRMFDIANGVKTMTREETEKIVNEIKAIPTSTPGRMPDEKIQAKIKKLMAPVASISDQNRIMNDVGYRDSVVRDAVMAHGAEKVAPVYKKSGLLEKFERYRNDPTGSTKDMDRAAVEKYVQEFADDVARKTRQSYGIDDILAKPSEERTHSDRWNTKYANDAVDREVGRMLEYTIHLTGQENLSAMIPNFSLEKAGSNYAKTAEAMGEYWKRPWEMFARAFESYVYDKLAEKGVRNTYLVSGVSKEEAAKWGKKAQLIEKDGGETSPYPIGEERTRINAAMDGLISAIKSVDLLKKAETMMFGEINLHGIKI